jgi:hypothetical protein
MNPWLVLGIGVAAGVVAGGLVVLAYFAAMIIYGDALRPRGVRAYAGALATFLWRLRYQLYDRDVTRPLRSGRGTHENPLTLDDLRPVTTMMRRIKYDELRRRKPEPPEEMKG